MADEPEWTTVLDVMYEDLHTLRVPPSGGVLQSATDPESDDVSLLAERTDYDMDKLDTILERMEAGGLVDSLQLGTESPEAKTLGLNETGFKVAHDRRNSKRQHETNLVLAVFTIGLFLTALVQAFSAITAAGQRDQLIIAGLLVAVAAGLVYVLMTWEPLAEL